MIKIGVASAFIYPDSNRATFSSKSLCFIEKDMANYLSRPGVVPILIPDLGSQKEREAMLSEMDALVLQGGSDIAPETYGENAINGGQWLGDSYRDEFELELLEYAIKNGMPVFGICRGFQLMNVYFGGSLFQDLPTQRPELLKHRDAVLYDGNHHGIEVVEGSWMSRLVKEKRLKVNSIHHQGIKDLGKGLIIQAKSIEESAKCSKENAVVEAFVWEGASEEGRVVGVQWHPEFFYNSQVQLFDTDILFANFLNTIKKSIR